MELDGLADILARRLDVVLAPLVRRLQALEAAAAGGTAAATVHGATLEALTLRTAALEARPVLPGPPGADGAAGLGFDDLEVHYDGAHTVTLEFKRGELVKAWPLVMPNLIYQGSYVDDGRRYMAGDVVSYAGSTWHCHKATAARPGDGAPGWRLMVKRARDGRDAGR
jgi:hypothetical protein